MKVLVTGATGFIGQRLISTLQNEHHQIICAVRSDSNRLLLQDLGVEEFVDILDEKALILAMSECSAVIHLAGQLGKFGTSYETYFETNCVLTEHLAVLAVRAGVLKFIFCSTPGVYGFGQRLCPEDAPYAPRNDYEKTKVFAEKKLVQTCSGTGTAYIILRPDFVYGPGDRRRIKMYRNIWNRKFVLTTSGESYLHPTYIDDVIQGFMLCLENPQANNQIFNIAAETDVTAQQFLCEIAKEGGVSLVKVNIGYTASVLAAGVIDKTMQIFFHKEGFVSKNKIDFLSIDHSSSIEKAKNLIGYKPEYPLERGLSETFTWCKEHSLL